MKRACENCEWWTETAETGLGWCHGLPPYLRTVDPAQTQKNQFCSLFRASEAKIREAG